MEPKDLEMQEGDNPDEPGSGAAEGVEREWLGDHPELAPDESRISAVTGEDLEKESIRRTANTGDIVDDAGDASTGAGPNPELDFDRGPDYMGSEASRAETEDFSRGAGSGERPQVTATQAFGRDIGISGLPGDRALIEEEGNRPRRANPPSDWTAVLGRLGGSSPGSEENQQLFEKFSSVRFPASRDEVLRSLPPSAEFRARTVSVDLREAITDSRVQSFRNLYDLIDAVKDEIRRSEKRQPHPA